MAEEQGQEQFEADAGAQGTEVAEEETVQEVDSAEGLAEDSDAASVEEGEPEQAVDALMTGIYVKRVSKQGESSDPNLYITLSHDIGKETTTVQSVFTGKRVTLPWDEIEFYEDSE